MPVRKKKVRVCLVPIYRQSLLHTPCTNLALNDCKFIHNSWLVCSTPSNKNAALTDSFHKQFLETEDYSNKMKGNDPALPPHRTYLNWQSINALYMGRPPSTHQRRRKWTPWSGLPSSLRPEGVRSSPYRSYLKLAKVENVIATCNQSEPITWGNQPLGFTEYKQTNNKTKQGCRSSVHT